MGTCSLALDGRPGMTGRNRWRRGSAWRSVLGAREDQAGHGVPAQDVKHGFEVRWQAVQGDSNDVVEVARGRQAGSPAAGSAGAGEWMPSRSPSRSMQPTGMGHASSSGARSVGATVPALMKWSAASASPSAEHLGEWHAPPRGLVDEVGRGAVGEERLDERVEPIGGLQAGGDGVVGGVGELGGLSEPAEHARH